MELTRKDINDLTFWLEIAQDTFDTEGGYDDEVAKIGEMLESLKSITVAVGAAG